MQGAQAHAILRVAGHVACDDLCTLYMCVGADALRTLGADAEGSGARGG